MRSMSPKNKLEYNVDTDELALIYARASTDMQGETVEHQVSIIQEWSKRANMPFVFDERYIFRDESDSAFKTTLLQRPAMRQLLEIIDDGFARVIIFKGISRFARSSGEAISTVEELVDRGVRVISIEENYDSNRDDPTFFQMYAVMAEAESRKTSIRVSLGNKQKARNGISPATTMPLGYSRVKNLKDKELKERLLSEGRHPESAHPNDDAQIIETVFRMYVEEGRGRKQIAEWLNKNGYKTSQGCFFDSRGLKRILNNRMYIGDVVYGMTRKKYIKDRTKNKKTEKIEHIDESDWAVYKNAHPAIVSRECFRKAELIQKERESKYENKGNFNSAKHPLVGIAKCGKCGGNLRCHVRQTITKKGIKHYRYYVCTNKEKIGASFCNQKNINADALENTVYDYIQCKIEELKLKYEDIKSNIVKDSGKMKSLEKSLKSIEAQIVKEMNSMKLLYDDREVYDEDTFNGMRSMYLGKIKELKENKANIESELESFQYDDDDVDMEEVFSEFMEVKLNGFTVDKRSMFHEWVEEIIVDEKNIKNLVLKIKD